MNTPEAPPIRWRKSTYSGAHENNCVEVADFNGRIGLRDSKAPEVGHLTLSRESFATLLNRLTAQTS